MRAAVFPKTNAAIPGHPEIAASQLIRPARTPRAETPAASLRLHEQPDQAGRALDVLVELGLQLRQREAGRQFLGVEIGRDDQEGVVVRRAGRGAWAGIMADALRALAADVLRAVIG